MYTPTKLCSFVEQLTRGIRKNVCWFQHSKGNKFNAIASIEINNRATEYVLMKKKIINLTYFYQLELLEVEMFGNWRTKKSLHEYWKYLYVWQTPTHLLRQKQKINSRKTFVWNGKNRSSPRSFRYRNSDGSAKLRKIYCWYINKNYM